MTLASSWSIIIFHSRTFSNSIECITLSILGGIILTTDWEKSEISSFKNITIGILVAFGIFTRFTFCVFFFPFVLFVLWHTWKISLFRIVRVGTEVLFGFLTTCFCISLIDSIYFGKMNLILDDQILSLKEIWITLSPAVWTRISLQGHLTWTPLNSFLYNIKYENLAIHGIHNRLTHSLLNMPLLFGPLYLATPLFIYQSWKKSIFPTSVALTLNGCFVCGLILLSQAAHQELRFLIPLIFPLSLLSRGIFFNHDSHISLKIIWILFNLIMTIFFGIFHQGGIVPAISYIQGESHRPLNLVFFHTYMPPRFMLAAHKGDFRVEDLGGADLSELEKVLNSLDNNRTFVIVPGSVNLCQKESNFSRTLLQEFGPHFSGEDPPSWNHLRNQMKLQLYEIERTR